MVNLGDKVKDRVSGFCGVAVGKHDYLQGCTRITVQPAVDDNGKLPDTGTFDEPLLDVVVAGAVKPGTDIRGNAGGPEKWPDTTRFPPSSHLAKYTDIRRY